MKQKMKMSLARDSSRQSKRGRLPSQQRQRKMKIVLRWFIITWMSYNEQKEFRGITLLNAFTYNSWKKKTLDFVFNSLLGVSYIHVHIIIIYISGFFFGLPCHIMLIKWKKFNFIFISTEWNTILNGCYKRFIAYCLSFFLFPGCLSRVCFICIRLLTFFFLFHESLFLALLLFTHKHQQ